MISIQMRRAAVKRVTKLNERSEDVARHVGVSTKTKDAWCKVDNSAPVARMTLVPLVRLQNEVEEL